MFFIIVVTCDGDLAVIAAIAADAHPLRRRLHSRNAMEWERRRRV